VPRPGQVAVRLARGGRVGVCDLPERLDKSRASRFRELKRSRARLLPHCPSPTVFFLFLVISEIRIPKFESIGLRVRAPPLLRRDAHGKRRR